MTLAAVPVKQYSSFDLYKQGFTNTNSPRTPRSLRSSVVVSSRPTQQSSKSSSKGSTHRFSPRTVLIAVLVVISFIAVTLPATKAFGGLSLVPAERPTADLKGKTIAVIVEEGDTLWSVANRIDPKKDPDRKSVV